MPTVPPETAPADIYERNMLLSGYRRTGDAEEGAPVTDPLDILSKHPDVVVHRHIVTGQLGTWMKEAQVV